VPGAYCKRVVDAAVDNLGQVDVLINNAGVATAVPATRETPEEFRRMIDVNLVGAYFMAQASGPGHGNARRQHRQYRQRSRYCRSTVVC